MKTKKFFILTLALICFNTSFSQCVFTFIDSNKLSKDDNYKICREYIAKAFTNSKSIIQMDDKEIGKIICKGDFEISTSGGLFGTPKYDMISFTLTIDVKENKYRTVYNELIHKSGYSGIQDGGSLCNEKPNGNSINFSKKRWLKVKEDASKSINDFNKDLKYRFSIYKSDNF